jgi:dipeptidyl aminopeptidase/acylaminoacyl peptidase
LPVAFLVHGGPQGSFGDHFHYRWNPQAYAGSRLRRGVHRLPRLHRLRPEAFTDAINGDWGGAPYEDLMLGLDFALAEVHVARRQAARPRSARRTAAT